MFLIILSAVGGIVAAWMIQAGNRADEQADAAQRIESLQEAIDSLSNDAVYWKREREKFDGLIAQRDGYAGVVDRHENSKTRLSQALAMCQRRDDAYRAKQRVENSIRLVRRELKALPLPPPPVKHASAGPEEQKQEREGKK